METLVLAIDPGQEKIGIALIDQQGNSVFRTIAPASEFPDQLKAIRQQFPDLHTAVGNSTGREKVIDFLRKLHIQYTLVDERNSSQEARILFFKEYPPRGWKKILPLSFLFPDRPFDDFQAIVIGRRYLEAESLPLRDTIKEESGKGEEKQRERFS